MNILIVCNSVLPAKLYGGTERVVWDLGEALVKQGHKLSFLAKKGSVCNFAEIIEINPNKSINSQIPENTDIVHFNSVFNEDINKPYIITIHGNGSENEKFDINSVFVSNNHAKRHNSESYVYNGLDWDKYQKPDLNSKRENFHFLGNAGWKVKNLDGAIKVCEKAKEKIYVIGGNRIKLKMGMKIHFSSNAIFLGMLNNEKKIHYLNKSKALIFPVLWDEPFGLAIIESLYMGCPVFGTPYGSLPELVSEKYGKLSTSLNELSIAIKNTHIYDRKILSEYASENFNAETMSKEYLKKYEIVLNGKTLNESNPFTLKNKTKHIFK